jgi:hypothetical protein
MLTIPEKVPEMGLYYHYKHDPAKGVRDYAYEVTGVNFHTEKNCRPEDVCTVQYRPLYTEAAVYQASLKLGVRAFDKRPLEMFMEDATKDGQKVPRFQKITDPAVIAELKKVKEEMYPNL